jgi:O-antigen ligase
MAFLYPFVVLLQPGILWPQLEPYKPQLLASIIAALYGVTRPQAGAQLGSKLAQPVFLWLVAYVAVQVVSVYYGGFMTMLETLDFWGTFAVFVLTSALLITDRGQLYRYIAGMLAASAVIINYGIVAVIIHAPQLAGNRAGAYGMYENHNDYTFLILMALPFAYMAIRLARGQLLLRLLLLGFVLACIAGTVLSLSRGGILALVMMLLMLYWSTTTGFRRALGLVLLLLIGAGGIVWQFAAREENQLGHYSLEDSQLSRYELWRAARKIIEQHPLLGVGSGRFQDYARNYAELSHDNIGKVSHNTYLEVATGSGLLGLLTFTMMLWHIVRASSERWRAAPSGVPPPLRIATQVCIWTIMFRGMLDAKTYDWSFYFLAVMAIVIATLPDTGTETGREAASNAASLPIDVRPAVYGRRG